MSDIYEGIGIATDMLDPELCKTLRDYNKENPRESYNSKSVNPKNLQNFAGQSMVYFQ